MDLEKMNKDYVESKTALAKSTKLMSTLENLKKDIKTFQRQLEDIEISIKRANEDEDKNLVKTLQEDKKIAKKGLEDKTRVLRNLENIVNKNQATIDSKMAELSMEPDLKIHLNKIIEEKFKKNIERKSQEKENIKGQNKPLQEIQEAAQKDPNVMYNLKEIAKYTKLISEAEAIITDTTKSPFEIAEAQHDLAVNRTNLEKTRSSLARHFKGTISREVIDKITSYEDLARTIKSNEKYISGLDKQIVNYRTALQSLEIDEIKYNILNAFNNTTKTNSVEAPILETSSAEASKSDEKSEKTPSTNLPAEQPKWFQFGKRFKNWISRRKIKAEQQKENQEQEEPEAQKPQQEPQQKQEIQQKQEPQVQAPASNEKKNEFKNSMKYEIVRDYSDQLANDLLKQAAAKNKQKANNDRDEH